MKLLKKERRDEKMLCRVNKTKMLEDSSMFYVKEAYNSARTKIMFTAKGEKCPVYVLTSAHEWEGKSLNIVNLAISFSMLDKKVLIIDSDMRKPVIHEYFDVDKENGLSEFLAQMQGNINIKKTKFPNLFVLTAGEIPPNPADLMESKKYKELIDELKNSYDYIFIDTPPLEVVMDAAIITEYTTGYIVVVRKNYSDLRVVENIVGTLNGLGGNIVGFLINDTNQAAKDYHKKRYSYYEKS